jgi:hypothetical protein
MAQSFSILTKPFYLLAQFFPFVPTRRMFRSWTAANQCEERAGFGWRNPIVGLFCFQRVQPLPAVNPVIQKE